MGDDERKDEHESEQIAERKRRAEEEDGRRTQPVPARISRPDQRVSRPS